MSTPAPEPDRPEPSRPELSRPELSRPGLDSTGPAGPAVPERPVLPDRAEDDLDVGWGDPGEKSRDDDERFLRERPPHWE